MDYTVGILAGGKSSRFCSDKRNAIIEGRTFLENAVQKFSYAPELILSVGVSNDIPLFDRVSVVRDSVADNGPIEGISSVLSHMSFPYAFIVPVDMPLVNRSIADYLASNIDNSSDIICPSVNGRIYPLCAFYSANVLSLVNKLKENGVLRLMRILDEGRTKIVEMPDSFRERLFINVNTPEDYRNLTDPALS